MKSSLTDVIEHFSQHQQTMNFSYNTPQVTNS